jgi:hypothetical protein
MAKRKAKPKTVGSKLRPSNADRYINCPASVVAAQDIELDDGTVYAETGNVAHALAEESWKQGRKPETFIGEELCADRGIKIPVDQKMVEDVTIYLDWIETMGFTKVVMEQEVQLPWIKNKGGEVTTGFADLVGYNGDFNTLVVADYKNGVMPVSDASYQFALYAMPLIMESDSPFPDMKEVHTYRVQPNIRGGSRIGSHVWTRGDLIRLKAKIEFTVDWVKKTKAKDLTKKDFCEGDWCKFCPNKHQCPLKAQAMFDVVPMEKELPAVTSLNDEQIALILDKRKDIVSWLDDVYKFEISQALNGKVREGLKLVEGRSKARAWKKDLSEDQIIETLVADGGLMKDECYQPAKVITPATVKKILKGKLTPVESLLTPAEKSVELVPESDKRESKDGSEMFSAITEPEVTAEQLF